MNIDIQFFMIPMYKTRMPTITNVNHGAFPDTSRRSYISAAAFNTAIFTYTPEVQDGTGNVTPGSLAALSGGNSGNCPARRVLRETGKKLYPGVHSGVFTYMVSVYDNNNMWHGYIDPNSALFAVYNSDKPNFLLNGVDAATGAPADAGVPVITNGLVLAGTGLGYGVAAVGAITQLTSKATTVILNGVTGLVTTFNDALAANASVTFTLTNASIGANDFLLVNHKSGGTMAAYNLSSACSNGSATISLTNVTAGSLTEAPVIQFLLIKVVVL